MVSPPRNSREVAAWRKLGRHMQSCEYQPHVYIGLTAREHRGVTSRRGLGLAGALTDCFKWGPQLSCYVLQHGTVLADGSHKLPDILKQSASPTCINTQHHSAASHSINLRLLNSSWYWQRQASRGYTRGIDRQTNFLSTDS